MPRVFPGWRRNPVTQQVVGLIVQGGASRRVALTSVITAVGIAGAAFAPGANAAPTTTATAVASLPKVSESCGIPPFASAHYLVQSGHAISGTWTLAPRITCDQGKTLITISVTLKRNGATQLTSSGVCRRQNLKFCKTAVGPRRAKSYSTSIRGTWTAAVSYTVGGADAILFAHSSPSAGKCSFVPTNSTAVCHYNTAPVVIR
jgi:hypothetical protein